MGRLVVEARGTAATGAGQGIAAAGNRDPMPIIVSVTDTEGAPVSGLDATNLTIEAEWVVQGGSGQVQIGPTAIGDHGNYRLGVVLGDDDQGNPMKWASGRYIFLLAVTSGVDQGQTLCDVLVQ